MQESTCGVPECGKPIHHKRNGWCKMHQARWERNGTLELRPRPVQRRCEIDGCENDARSLSAALCPKHYHRQYRHGSVSMVSGESGITVSHGRRYKTIYVPGHPVANKHGMAYEHRVVLHAKIGPGVHQCHWCEMEVRWEADRLDPDVLQVDHLNAIGDDNRRENLVPSCRRCNTVRAAQARHDALAKAGFWSKNDTIAKLRDGRAERVDARL